VIFSGTFSNTINFGGGDLRWTPGFYGPPRQGFLVKLTPDARHVYSRVVDGKDVRGLAADGLGNAAVSTLSNEEPHLINFGKFDGAGALRWWKQAYFGSEIQPNGRGHAFDLAMDPFGRVYVQIYSQPDVESSVPLVAGYAP
jgi:hypothetical protein